ncbi:MAG: hypothetical protein U0892_08300 [Pirellulales bacterium]
MSSPLDSCSSSSAGTTDPGDHDFGKNIIPSIIDEHRVFAFPFKDENRKQGLLARCPELWMLTTKPATDLIGIDHEHSTTIAGRYTFCNRIFLRLSLSSAVTAIRIAVIGQLIGIVCQGTVIGGGSVRHAA